MSFSSADEDDGYAVGTAGYESDPDDADEDLDTGSDESEVRLIANESSKSSLPPATEWIEFNNKVVAMRPLFKSAKVQFANKLTRQIRMLKKRKGEEEQVKKCLRKAERLVEEISYVNRLKQDIVAKFALLHSKEEIMKIVNDPSSSMEYRVKAKVAAMPKISKAADDYHRTHPDWRETLIKLIQLAGSKMKKKRRKIRGKGKKSKKKKTGEANPKKPNSRVVSTEDDGTGRFVAANFPEPPPAANGDSSHEGSTDEDGWNPPEVRVGSSSEEDSDSNEEEDLNLRITFDRAKMNHKKATTPGVPQKQGHDRIKSNMPDKMTLQSPQQKSQNPVKRTKDEENSPKKVPKFTSENVKSANVSRENRREKGIIEPFDSDEIQSGSEKEETSDSTKPRNGNVDPFFLTSDNKEYKTLWKVEPADSFKNKDKDKEKEPVFVFKNARSYEDVKSGVAAKRPNIPNKKDKKSRGKPTQGPLDPATLHPSWQAKKNMNLTTAPFQGKKIVFDDD